MDGWIYMYDICLEKMRRGTEYVVIDIDIDFIKYDHTRLRLLLKYSHIHRNEGRAQLHMCSAGML